MGEAYVIDAVRTPFGKYGGSLAGVRPDDMAAGVIGSLLERAPALDPARIDDVIFGNANGAGEENRNVARMAALLAGLPTSVPGTTVNRLCASSLEAAIQASRAIEVGDADVVLTGGVESMSRAPWVMLKPERAFDRSDQSLHSTTLGWRLVNPAMPERWTIALGESAELLASRHEISRERQDEFAQASHRKSAAAWESGFYGEWVIAVEDTEAVRDENMRPEITKEQLADRRPAFAEDGTVTAGNSSPLNDGAAAVLIAGAEAAESIGGRADRADCRPRRLRSRPGSLRDRAGGGREPRPTARGNRLGRCLGTRAQRSVRLAVARMHRRAGRSSIPPRQPERRRDRARAPARRFGLARPRRARPRASPSRRGVGRGDPLYRGRPGSWRLSSRPERDEGPVLDWPDYRSTRLRVPRRPMTEIPQTLGDLSGPAFGSERIGDLDNDLTRQHGGEPRASGSSSPAACWTATAGRSRGR